MIWLIWQRYRLLAALGLLALVALIYLFVLDANILNAASEQHHFMHCYAKGYIPCGLMIIPNNTAQWRSIAAIVLPLLPFCVGIFLGAPLIAREYELRTHLFTWTQKLSRARWLTIHLIILVGAILLGVGGLTLVTTWWGNIQDLIASSPWHTFTIRGSVPVANALASLMLGVMVGACIRRPLPAMAVTLLLLIPLQYAILFGYPYMLPPMRYFYSSEAQGNVFGRQDFLISQKYIKPDGNTIGFNDLLAYCNFDNGFTAEQMQRCMDQRHLKILFEYQRFDERFWPLQIATTIVLLALAALFTVITYWQLQRRIV